MKKLKLKVNFDVCTFCNHQCNFCSNPDNRTIKSQVNIEQYSKVMDNISKYIEIEELGLSAKGEVLINKDLANIIKISKEKYNIKYLYISSNGALFVKEKIDELLSAGLDSTKFSINAVTKETYKKIHNQDDFDIVIENLKYLIEAKKIKFINHKIFISSVTTIDKNLLEKKFEELLGKENMQYINDIFVFKLDYTSKFEETKSNEIITKGCPIPFNEVYINSDCSLGFCCKDYFDEINFGSLLNNDFLDLYHCKQYEDIRKMHIKKEFPNNHLCKNCLLYKKENDV